MSTFLMLVAIAAVILYFGYSQTKRQPSTPEQNTGRGQNNEIALAKQQLAEIMDACTAAHPEAVHALIFIAGSDGTVSRQELRVIIGFCERQGATIKLGWKSVLDYLNAGLQLSITGGEAGAKENIASLSAKPMAYRAAFLGAAEAILAANSTTNKSKRNLVEQARKLIEQP